MQKTFLILPLLAALLGAGCFPRSAPFSQVPDLTNTATGTTEQGPDLPAVTTSSTVIRPELFKTMTKTEEGKGYMIDLEYPRMEGFADAAIQDAFNREVEERTNARFDEFKKNAKEMGAEDEIMTGLWSLSQTFTVYTGAYGRFSIVFSGSEYTGGAHPNPFFDTIVFDLATQKPLTLKDLFKPGSDYVSVLSRRSIASLKAQDDFEAFTDENWLMDGAGPNEKNFQTFYLTTDGLTIIFPPYQVAAYAAGTFTVDIRYSDIDTILAL